jgi:beta-phosphoglucomutase
MIQALIFDMDGTMIDNMMVHHRAWQIVLKGLGLDLDLEQIRQELHGKNEEILARIFGDRFSENEFKRIAWQKEFAYRKVFFEQLAPIPGLMEVLEQAKDLGLKLGIGTAAPPENVNFVLDNIFGLRDYFSAIVHAGMVKRGKPDPQVHELVSAQLGIPLTNTLIFEDSPTGVETAQRAGCEAVVITTTHSEEEFTRFPNVRRFVETYEELDLEEILK